ncbi:MAG: ABC1 kinase family protein [Anaerolineae bacterium]
MNRFSTRPTRHAGRYREIAAALARHGLGWLVLQLGLGDLIPFERGLLGHPRRAVAYTRPEHFRLALEDLGATFIKLGQILSVRPDLLPPDYTAEFARLQDAAPAVAYPEVAAIIEEELGKPPDTLYAEFEHVPRASASIGQAHAARLPDGTAVIVKVQRPGIARVVEQDLAVLSDLVRLAATRTPLGEYYDPEALISEFAYTLRNELDYCREGRNADRIRRNFQDEPALHVPRIQWEYTTRRVLTIEEIQGIKINDLEALRDAGHDPRVAAENSVRIMLTQVFAHGFFHADPHPGNFFVLPGSIIGLIDYGMVGRLDEELRDRLLRLMLALVRRDTSRLVEELAEMGVTKGRLNRGAFQRDLDQFIDEYYDLPLAEMAAAQTFNEVIAIAFKHHLQLPGDLMLLVKVIAMSESLGAQLDPDFKLLPFAKPYIQDFWLGRRTPFSLAKRLTEGLLDTMDLGLDLPLRLRSLLNQVERGEVTITARQEGWKEPLAELNRIANRLAMSVLVASLIITLGLLMLVYHPQTWALWAGPVFTTLFFLVLVLGLGLLWSIWRSR